MKWLIFILLLTGCSTWTTQEKVLLGVSCLAATTDAYTTARFLDREGSWEMNPVMGKHPSGTEVITYMISSQMIAIVLAHYFPKYRSWILSIKTGLNTVGTLNNLTLYW